MIETRDSDPSSLSLSDCLDEKPTIEKKKFHAKSNSKNMTKKFNRHHVSIIQSVEKKNLYKKNYKRSAKSIMKFSDLYRKKGDFSMLSKIKNGKQFNDYAKNLYSKRFGKEYLNQN